MASIITGLFKSQDQSRKISEDLAHAGFKDSDFILYLHDHKIPKEVKTSVWNYFFGDHTEVEEEHLVISVKVKTPEQIESVAKIWSENGVIQQNYYENVKFEAAKSLDCLKRLVALRARAQIYQSPEIKIHENSEGISSEVTF
ncbi:MULTISPECIES: hypothetical protein [Chryseobacterium]|uniref:hypothetical protein n=1 Tax=Chryseobacterium sp. R2A-55 TaxID=2744445 RepID=UPI001F1C478F|nr:hypothetical protein [Chryseobacterium sp. R2A-55]